MSGCRRLVHSPSSSPLRSAGRGVAVTGRLQRTTEEGCGEGRRGGPSEVEERTRPADVDVRARGVRRRVGRRGLRGSSACGSSVAADSSGTSATGSVVAGWAGRSSGSRNVAAWLRSAPLGGAAAVSGSGWGSGSVASAVTSAAGAASVGASVGAAAAGSADAGAGVDAVAAVVAVVVSGASRSKSEPRLPRSTSVVGVETLAVDDGAGSGSGSAAAGAASASSACGLGRGLGGGLRLLGCRRLSRRRRGCRRLEVEQRPESGDVRRGRRRGLRGAGGS